MASPETRASKSVDVRCPGCGKDVLIEWDAVLRRCSSVRRWYRCARSNISVMRASRSSCWSDDSSGGRNGSGFRRAIMGCAIITCAYLARNQGKLLVGEISVPFCERHNSLLLSGTPPLIPRIPVGTNPTCDVHTSSASDLCSCRRLDVWVRHIATTVRIRMPPFAAIRIWGR